MKKLLIRGKVLQWVENAQQCSNMYCWQEIFSIPTRWIRKHHGPLRFLTTCEYPDLPHRSAEKEKKNTNDFRFKWRFNFSRFQRFPVDIAEKWMRLNGIFHTMSWYGTKSFTRIFSHELEMENEGNQKMQRLPNVYWSFFSQGVNQRKLIDSKGMLYQQLNFLRDELFLPLQLKSHNSNPYYLKVEISCLRKGILFMRENVFAFSIGQNHSKSTTFMVLISLTLKGRMRFWQSLNYHFIFKTLPSVSILNFYRKLEIFFVGAGWTWHCIVRDYGSVIYLWFYE